MRVYNIVVEGAFVPPSSHGCSASVRAYAADRDCLVQTGFRRLSRNDSFF